jgi:nitroreductase
VTSPVLDAIRTRRVVRAMSDEPVDRHQLEAVLDAARWAPNAGNRRLQRFVVVQHPPTLRALRMVSPGMLQRPAAAIVLCVDVDRVVAYGFGKRNMGHYVDVGTAMATMLLAAHSLGVGAGPVSSFSRAAVSTVLNLPAGWRPEVIVCLGYPAHDQPGPMARRRRLSWQELTHWERFPGNESAAGENDG